MVKPALLKRIKVGGYNKKANIATFVATFPVNNPRYVLAILVDEPKGQNHSFGYATAGWVAAPAVRRIVEQVAPMLGVLPVDEQSPSIRQKLMLDFKIGDKEATLLHLTDLCHNLISVPADAGEVPVYGLAIDSRKVGAGDVFFAVAGSHSDGRDYIADAVKAGAVTVITDDRPFDDGPLDIGSVGIPVLRSSNPRQVMALMAARFWSAQPDMVAAVTGTNGKTSTAEFLRQLWQRVSWRAVAMGTLGITGTEKLNFNGALLGLPSLTTPDSLSLHATINTLTEVGMTHLALEASSHGLEQHRLDGLSLHVAAFTNLSRDHLDHHTDMDSYFAAKLRLFTALLKPGGHAVINIDDPHSHTDYQRLRRT